MPACVGANSQTVRRTLYPHCEHAQIGCPIPANGSLISSPALRNPRRLRFPSRCRCSRRPLRGFSTQYSVRRDLIRGPAKRHTTTTNNSRSVGIRHPHIDTHVTQCCRYPCRWFVCSFCSRREYHHQTTASTGGKHPPRHFDIPDNLGRDRIANTHSLPSPLLLARPRERGKTEMLRLRLEVGPSS